MRSPRLVLMACGLVINLLATLPSVALADNDSREGGDPDDAYNALPPTRQLESIPPSQKGGRDNPLRERSPDQTTTQQEDAAETNAAQDVGFWSWPFDNDDPYYDRSRRLDRR